MLLASKFDRKMCSIRAQTAAVILDIRPLESKCSNFKISFLFRHQIKKCPSTRSPILSHHNFLMGSLDDSCQSNICSAFPLSRGAPVDLHLTSTGKQCGGREGLWFPVAGRRTEKTRKRQFYDHCLPWWRPASFLSFFFLNVPGKKMFHQGAGGEIFLIQMDGNFPPFST